MMHRTFFLIALLAAISADAKDFTLTSPNKKITVVINLSEHLTYSVSLNGMSIIAPSVISLKIDDAILGMNAKLTNTSRKSVNRQLEPVIRQKSAVIEDVYNEITLSFRGNYSLAFRAYDDGLAWRWETSLPGEVVVQGEEVSITFPDDYHIYFPEEQSMFTHQERLYLHVPLSELSPGRFCSLPALADLPGGIKVAITEADLRDYPGMYLTPSMSRPFQLLGLFPTYPLREELTGDRNVRVVEKARYMAVTKGTRTFPWRILVITEKDGDLIESQMVYKLSAPATAMDFTWVKPGKVAWDWWNANNIYGVDFRAGINTATYKYYIDFASEYGIEYIILDEGWYELGDLMKVSPEIDMEELMRYGREKNVGIILWVVWKTLWDQLDPVMDQFERWGVKGIKVDFMQRDDQWMVNYYWKIAEEAAKRHLLVDFHGSYKPAGLHRTWPNVITREGVRGLEWNKWSDGATPDNAVTIPFIRMLAGPMDYTPGAMVNATKEQFRSVHDRPMSQGTRCNQLAMYVVFESPLQMLADSPSHYYEEKVCMEFLSRVPVVWDQTIVLDAGVGEYVVLARRNGDSWYICAMTNWTPRDIEIDLSFLGKGTFNAKLWKDGPNADRYAEDFAVEELTVNQGEKLKLHLAPGGGFAGIISLED